MKTAKTRHSMLLPKLAVSAAFLGRWRDLLDAGVMLIGSTDTPWSPAPTTKALHEVVTCIGESGATPRPWILDQTITIEEALRLITIDAAYGTFEEDIKGSLAPGKLADLVILSQNPLDVDTQDLPAIDVVATIVGGGAVHCAPDLPALCDSWGCLRRGWHRLVLVGFARDDRHIRNRVYASFQGRFRTARVTYGASER